MKKISFAALLFLAALCFSPPAFADNPIFTLKQRVSIGIAPDGKQVEYVYYYNDMLRHFQYIFFLTLSGEQDWPQTLEARDSETKKPDELYVYLEEEADSAQALRFEPSTFHRSDGEDAEISWYFSPDGMAITVHENSYDIYTGEGWNITKRFTWEDGEYSLVEENGISRSEQAVRVIEQALLSADWRGVITALRDLGKIDGSAGSLLRYPPDRLILPLWHFFHFKAVQGGYGSKEGLLQFLDASVYTGISTEMPTLEGFLVYSLTVPGVRAHVEACAVLLEDMGEKEKAAIFRTSLEKQEK